MSHIQARWAPKWRLSGISWVCFSYSLDHGCWQIPAAVIGMCWIFLIGRSGVWMLPHAFSCGLFGIDGSLISVFVDLWPRPRGVFQAGVCCERRKHPAVARASYICIRWWAVSAAKWTLGLHYCGTREAQLLQSSIIYKTTLCLFLRGNLFKINGSVSQTETFPPKFPSKQQLLPINCWSRVKNSINNNTRTHTWVNATSPSCRVIWIHIFLMTQLIQTEMAKYNFALEMSKLFQSWMKKK